MSKMFTKTWRRNMQKEIETVGVVSGTWTPEFTAPTFPRLSYLFPLTGAGTSLTSGGAGLTLLATDERAWAVSVPDTINVNNSSTGWTFKLPDPANIITATIAVGFASNEAITLVDPHDYCNSMVGIVIEKVDTEWAITGVWDNGDAGVGQLLTLDPEDYVVLPWSSNKEIAVSVDNSGVHGQINISHSDTPNTFVFTYMFEADFTFGRIYMDAAIQSNITNMVLLIDQPLVVHSNIELLGQTGGVDVSDLPAFCVNTIREITGLETPVVDPYYGTFDNGKLAVFNLDGDFVSLIPSET